MVTGSPLLTQEGKTIADQLRIGLTLDMVLQKSSSLKHHLKIPKAKIAIVVSRFNETITKALLVSAQKGLKEAGIPEKSIQVFEVPGAFEIPLAALEIARSKAYEGMICLGAVIRGETPHFDYVCLAVTEGVLRAQLETRIPISFGVLTTDTIEQALARAGNNSENKGYEAAKVVIEMVELIRRIKNGYPKKGARSGASNSLSG
jgi:6,7-dimethyl-8-ribityllumazine synthase